MVCHGRNLLVCIFFSKKINLSKECTDLFDKKFGIRKNIHVRTLCKIFVTALISMKYCPPL